ncbi:MAG: ScyD/ScyE family protein [Chloroflexota bacterium]
MCISASNVRRSIAAAFALMLAGAILALAPTPTSATAQRGDFDVVASGLSNPRGLAFGPDGSLYVAEAGKGGERLVQAGYDRQPYHIGTTARVTKISWTGHLITVLPRLPSVETRDDIYGAAGVAFIGDSLYVLTAAGGRDVGDRSFDNAILRVSATGRVTRVADITEINYFSPPLARLNDVRADVEGGVPFGLTAMDGRLYATDANLETVTEIETDGAWRRLVSLPYSNRVLVGLTPAPDGSLWVAEYGPLPHPLGSSHISRLTLDGELSEAWMGLNLAIGVAFGQDGSAYALQFAETSRTPGVGSIVRRTPDGGSETIISGLSFPTAITTGPDGNLYVSEFGHKSENESGRIIRVHVPTLASGQ